jgi:uncharacterized protein involved in outer membrane biogenesis
VDRNEKAQESHRMKPMIWFLTGILVMLIALHFIVARV